MSAAVILLSAASSASAQSCACVADINGDGEGDGIDLALVLGAWGTANQQADLSGNGTVDGTDLALVLGSWGPCAVPANDLCVNSQVIGPGSYLFCNTYAETDGPSLPGDSCGDFANQINNDLWYQFTPQSNGTLTVETCNAADFDTVIAVYTSPFDFTPCPTDGIGLTSLAGCSDDAAGCGLTSKVTLSVSADKVYLIRVGSFSAGSTGSGTLSLAFSHPGESCANSKVANNVPSTVTIYGDTSDNAVADLPNACFGGLPQGPAEWITYTATCNGILTIDTCDPTTNFDTVLTVLRYEFDGNCWSTFIECNDDSAMAGCQLGGQNRKSWLQVPCGPGEVFRIVVSGFNGAKGIYALSIDRNCN